MQYRVTEPTAYQKGNTASDSSLYICISAKSTTQQGISSYAFLNIGIFFSHNWLTD